jgi:glycosyltransferase involved in cell wall biosynthesis
MSQHAIMTATAAQSAGIPCAIVDMNAGTSIEDNDAVKLGCKVVRDCLYSVNVAAFTPAMLPHEFGAIGLPLLEECHNIYYGNWEYPQYPPDHIKVIESFDEVWAPSRFTFEALKNVISKPLHYVPLSITMTNSLSGTRADFNLPNNAFLFLNTFDFHSNILRKNPYGCVKAFLEAFPQGNEAAALVIKAMNIRTTSNTFSEWLKVKEAAQADPRIIIIEQQISRQEIDSLIYLCDAFISLHRAEGFGLAIAEAMFMSKPVIVTNYSGNTEFTLSSNSCLVNNILVRPPEAILKRLGVETTWGEPDVSHAAWYMRQLFTEKDYRKKLAEAGHEYISKNYSPAVIGQIIKKHLNNIINKNSMLTEIY